MLWLLLKAELFPSAPPPPTPVGVTAAPEPDVATSVVAAGHKTTVGVAIVTVESTLLVVVRLMVLLMGVDEWRTAGCLLVASSAVMITGVVVVVVVEVGMLMVLTVLVWEVGRRAVLVLLVLVVPTLVVVVPTATSVTRLIVVHVATLVLVRRGYEGVLLNGCASVKGGVDHGLRERRAGDRTRAPHGGRSI